MFFTRAVKTTKEQTVIDCLEKPSLSGGVEEAVRSLTAFVYLDVDALLFLLEGRRASTVSRVGWLLEEKAKDWRVEADTLSKLAARLGGGPYRFGHARAGDGGWSPRWKLLLPERNEEVETWIMRS